MPHQRKRHILELLEKRLKLFPVVGVLGARQTGKSTLLRELLPKHRKIKYVTLDREENRNLAQKQPTLFIQNLESSGIATVCLDEVQKAPILFDTIKAEVDEKKQPGRFALSGSTEFSKKTGVRDALTGRIALLRLFPLNLSETLNSTQANALIKPVKDFGRSNGTLKDVRIWLDRGGMPGIFSIREKSNRETLFESWIDATCVRDLAQFNIPRFNPDLARRALIETARAEIPNRTAIASAVDRQPRQIEPYLQAFKALHVLYEIEPHANGVGKPVFYLFDAGMAELLGASLHRRLQIWFLNECFSQFSYSGEMRPDIFYYRTTRGSEIDFVVHSRHSKYAVKLCHEEAPSTYTLRSTDAFLKKHKDIPILILAPCLTEHKLKKNLRIIPWNAVAS